MSSPSPTTARPSAPTAPSPVLCAALLLALAVVPPVAAQSAPAVGQPAPSAQPAVPLPQALAVARYAVEGNTLLDPALLEATLAPYTGQVTLSRLREAAAAVQDLYRRAGYGGVVAFLPEQTLGEGVVRIRVVEGRLAAVEVTGNEAFSLGNIRASLPWLVEGTTPLVTRIDGQIQMANENPAKAVQVLLQPGSQPGELVARVEVQEAPVLRVNARLDNTGGESTGRWRAAAGVLHANLFGRDHVGALELQTAPENAGDVLVLSGSYRIPFYARALALDLYGAVSNVDAGTTGTAAGDLSFSGRGGIVGTRVGFYLPRRGNVDQRLFAGVEWRLYDNECRIAGLPDGACGSAGASVAVMPLALIYTAQASGDVPWGLSLGVHGNLPAGRAGRQADFEAVRAGASRRYALLRGQGHVSLPVGELGELGARLSVQFAGDALVPGELFGIGGAGSVRGFEERELAGDSGAQLTVEASSPNWADRFEALQGGELRVLLFADSGYVANTDDAACQAGRTNCRLGGAGAGLRVGLGPWRLRLDVARAFTVGTTTAKGDVRAHASLLYNF